MTKNVEENYVNQGQQKMGNRLWRTLVEKSVENVEKLEFSTAKTGFCTAGQKAAPGKIWGK